MLEQRDPKTKGRHRDRGVKRFTDPKWLIPLIIGPVFAAVVAFTVLEVKQAASEGDIQDNKEAIAANAKEITAVRETVIRIDERQIGIQNDVREILQHIKRDRLAEGRRQ